MASTISFSGMSKRADHILEFTTEIIADTDGSVESVATPFNIDGYVMSVVVVPSAIVAPQADYDIELQDNFGVDIMGGSLHNLAASGASQAMPLFGTDFFCLRFVPGPLTVVMSSNNVNGAKVSITIFVKDA